MSTINTVLADAIDLSAADRAALIRALRAIDAGLDLDPSSVRLSAPEDVRALCGREAHATAPSFEITARHIELISEAMARLTVGSISR